MSHQSHHPILFALPISAKVGRREETHQLRVVGGVDALTVEEEATALRLLALSLAEGIHELLQLCRALDLEEDFIVVIGHLDIKVFALFWRWLWCVAVATGRIRAVLRHFCGWVGGVRWKGLDVRGNACRALFILHELRR